MEALPFQRLPVERGDWRDPGSRRRTLPSHLGQESNLLQINFRVVVLPTLTENVGIIQPRRWLQSVTSAIQDFSKTNSVST